jgi:hypothetical protein
MSQSRKTHAHCGWLHTVLEVGESLALVVASAFELDALSSTAIASLSLVVADVAVVDIDGKSAAAAAAATGDVANVVAVVAAVEAVVDAMAVAGTRPRSGRTISRSGALSVGVCGGCLNLLSTPKLLRAIKRHAFQTYSGLFLDLYCSSIPYFGSSSKTSGRKKSSNVGVHAYQQQTMTLVGWSKSGTSSADAAAAAAAAADDEHTVLFSKCSKLPA